MMQDRTIPCSTVQYNIVQLTHITTYNTQGKPQCTKLQEYYEDGLGDFLGAILRHGLIPVECLLTAVSISTHISTRKPLNKFS